MSIFYERNECLFIRMLPCNFRFDIFAFHNISRFLEPGHVMKQSESLHKKKLGKKKVQLKLEFRM